MTLSAGKYSLGELGNEEAIVATYPDSSKTKYAGGLWIATYKNEPFKLYLVPMPGITLSDVDRGTLQQNLNNKIFSQAVINWTVGALPGFTSVDLGANGLDWADNAMLSSYNTEMNSVISAFKTWKPSADPDAYYLFIVPKFSEAGVEGFMPRNRRFGFVTLDQVKDRTVAHELGHGAFNLRHTFPEVPQGTTDNLMDYSEGVVIYKPQWDLIHHPEITTGLLDDMEDGAFSMTIHYDILKEAMDSVGGFKTELPLDFISTMLLDGVKSTDGLGFALDFHFDNKYTNKEIIDEWALLNSHFNKLTDLSAERNGWLLHELMDFYAHSNFVETYITYWVETGHSIQDLTLDNFPTYEIANDEKVNPKFNLQYSGQLKTGHFELWRWTGFIPGTVNKISDYIFALANGYIHHDFLNKDAPGTGISDIQYKKSNYTLHQFARCAALKATIKKLNEIK